MTCHLHLVGDPEVPTSLQQQYLAGIFPPHEERRPSPPRQENFSGTFALVEVKTYYGCDFNFSARVQGLLVVFDLTNRDSFVRLVEYTAGLIDSRHDPTRVLLGTKVDLGQRCHVSREDAEALAVSRGMTYSEVTTTDHESVRASINEVARAVLTASEAGYPAVIRAAAVGDVPGIEQAVREDAEGIDTTDRVFEFTAMHHAAKNGHVSAIEALDC